MSAEQPELFTRPCPLTVAHDYVRRLHRHHDPSQGGLWAVAVADKKTGRVCGVTVVGRPVARHLHDGRTVEVTRTATDGTDNACSCLLGAVGRYLRAFRLRGVTYTLPSESGASLRAAGWRMDGQTAARTGKGWANRPGRKNDHPEVKTRWILDCRATTEPDLVWETEPPTAQLALLGEP